MFTVTQGNKTVAVFNTLLELYNFYKRMYCGAYQLELRFSHDPYETYFGYGVHILPARIPYLVITNHNGLRLSRDHLLGEFRKFCKPRVHFYGFKRHPRCSYHRRPSTIQERALSVSVNYEDGEPRWRAKRNYHNLPNTYDDLQHYDVNNRNWKRYRLEQYK
jgi:hypothetical protein